MPFTDTIKSWFGYSADLDDGHVEVLAPPSDDYIPVETASQILATGQNPLLMEQIRSLVSLPNEAFEYYYGSFISRYAEFVQQVPASRYHHHAFRGGLVTHTLEVVVFALRLKDRYTIPPDTPPEYADKILQKWVWAIVAAGVLHDLAKPVTDNLVTLFDSSFNELGQWSPYSGAMTRNKDAAYYTIKFNPKPDYSFHSKLNAAFMRDIIPWEHLHWVSRELDLYNYFLNAMSGDYQNASIIGELVKAADKESTSMSLGTDSGKARADSTAVGLHDNILATIRHLFSEKQVPLNRRGATGYVDGDYVYVVSKTFTDLFKNKMESDGHSNVPSDNTRLFTLMQEHGIVHSTATGKAIWKARVQLHDDNGVEQWGTELTLLRLRLSHVIPEKDLQPEPMKGIVLVAEEDDPELYRYRNAKDEPLPQAQDNVEPAATSKTESADTDVEDTANQTNDAATTKVSSPIDAKAKEDSAGRASNKVDSQTSTETIEQSQEQKQSDSDQTATCSTKAKATNKDDDVTTKKPASTKQERAQEFIAWVKELAGKFEYNSTNSLLHVVQYEDKPHVLLTSPKIFKYYAEKVGDADRWTTYQRAFLGQSYHIRPPTTNANFVTFKVRAKRGSDKQIQGVLIRDWKLFFSEEPPVNSLLYQT